MVAREAVQVEPLVHDDVNDVAVVDEHLGLVADEVKLGALGLGCALAEEAERLAGVLIHEARNVEGVEELDAEAGVVHSDEREVNGADGGGVELEALDETRSDVDEVRKHPLGSVHVLSASPVDERVHRLRVVVVDGERRGVVIVGAESHTCGVVAMLVVVAVREVGAWCFAGVGDALGTRRSHVSLLAADEAEAVELARLVVVVGLGDVREAAAFPSRAAAVREVSARRRLTTPPVVVVASALGREEGAVVVGDLVRSLDVGSHGLELVLDVLIGGVAVHHGRLDHVHDVVVLGGEVVEDHVAGHGVIDGGAAADELVAVVVDTDGEVDELLMHCLGEGVELTGEGHDASLGFVLEPREKCLPNCVTTSGRVVGDVDADVELGLVLEGLDEDVLQHDLGVGVGVNAVEGIGQAVEACEGLELGPEHGPRPEGAIELGQVVELDVGHGDDGDGGGVGDGDDGGGGDNVGGGDDGGGGDNVGGGDDDGGADGGGADNGGADDGGALV